MLEIPITLALLVLSNSASASLVSAAIPNGATAGQQVAGLPNRQPLAQLRIAPLGVPIAVGSIAELRAVQVATLPPGHQALLSGYHATGDGGEGLFTYDPASNAVDDGGTVIAPNRGAGCWLRAFSGPVNARWFGARGDGTTDDQAPIEAALTASLSVYFPEGTYVYDGKLSSLGKDGRILRGDGTNASILKFTDATVNALIEITGLGFNHLLIEGLTIRGPGRTAGSNVHGIYIHDFNSNPYNLTLRDVSVTDVSGTGFHILDVFMTRFLDTWVERVGGNGHTLAGDQSPTIINSGQWSRDVTGWVWWVKSGNPFMQGLNCSGALTGGARFGDDDPAGFCFPVILGMNIEGLAADGSTGIQFELGSNLRLASGIQIYSEGLAVPSYGIRFVNMNDAGLFLGNPAFIGTFTNRWYADSFLPQAQLLVLGNDIDSKANDTLRRVTTALVPSGGTRRFALSRTLSSPGQINTGKLEVNRARITSNHSVLYTSGDYLLEVDASGGPVSITLDPTGFFSPGRQLVIKKIDASPNGVTVDTFGTETIDGVDNPTLTNRWASITIVNSGTEWLKIGSVTP
jgi:hypothetical protein